MVRKSKFIVIYLLAIFIALAFSGCSSGVPQEYYDLLKSELTSYQQQADELNQRLEESNTRVEDLTGEKDSLEDLVSTSAGLTEELNTRVEDLTRANAALDDLADNSARLNEELSAIAAYLLWYDYYYEVGAYDFNDTAAFNSQLGSLIAATGDRDAMSSFSEYLKADDAYNAVVDSLPESIWTTPEFEQWLNASKARKEALGPVGGHLLDKVKTISWFEAN